MNILKFIIPMLIIKSSLALDLQIYEDQCAEIGFNRKSTAFGECVLELYGRIKADTAKTHIAQNKDVSHSAGDKTPDHFTCAKYGFVVGTNEYSQCRMQIDLAKKEAEERQSQYERQLAENEKARRRAVGGALFLKGIGMMGGGAPSSGGLHSNTISPPSPMQVYTLPGGRTMTCTTQGAFTNCN